jgi:hypothetical protein
MTELEEVAQEYAAARDAHEGARKKLAAAIVNAANSGTRQNEIVRITGYTRERVRQICRAAGIEPE